MGIENLDSSLSGTRHHSQASHRNDAGVRRRQRQGRQGALSAALVGGCRTTLLLHHHAPTHPQLHGQESLHASSYYYIIAELSVMAQATPGRRSALQHEPLAFDGVPGEHASRTHPDMMCIVRSVMRRSGRAKASLIGPGMRKREESTPRMRARPTSSSPRLAFLIGCIQIRPFFWRLAHVEVCWWSDDATRPRSPGRGSHRAGWRVVRAINIVFTTTLEGEAAFNKQSRLSADMTWHFLRTYWHSHSQEKM